MMKRFFSIGCGVLFLIGAVLVGMAAVALGDPIIITLALGLLVAGLILGLALTRSRSRTTCDWCRQGIQNSDKGRFTIKDGKATVYFCSLKCKQEFIHSRDDPGQRIHEIKGY